MRGWKQVPPSRSRTPIPRYCIEAVVLWSLATGRQERGWSRNACWSAALGGLRSKLSSDLVSCVRFGSVIFPLTLPSETQSHAWWCGSITPSIVLVRNREVVSWIRWFCEGRHRKELGPRVSVALHCSLKVVHDLVLGQEEPPPSLQSMRTCGGSSTQAEATS